MIAFTMWSDSEISIGVGQNNNGKIYFSKLFSSIDFYLIADSFNDFINNFK